MASAARAVAPSRFEQRPFSPWRAAGGPGHLPGCPVQACCVMIISASRVKVTGSGPQISRTVSNVASTTARSINRHVNNMTHADGLSPR